MSGNNCEIGGSRELRERCDPDEDYVRKGAGEEIMGGDSRLRDKIRRHSDAPEVSPINKVSGEL